MSSFKVKIHHTVLLNISDHYTRRRYQFPKEPTVILGALIGTEEGEVINIVASFEVAFKAVAPDIIADVDVQNLTSKLKLLAQVFKGCELMGWYRTGGKTTPMKNNLELHRNFQAINQNALLLMFDPSENMRKTGKLAFQVFEKKPEHHEFTELPFEVEGDASEVITLDNLSKTSSVLKTSPLADHLSIFLNATKILNKKLDTLWSFLTAHPDILTKKPEVARQLKELLAAYPSQHSSELKTKLVDEYCEAHLITLLTQTVCTHRKIIEVFQMYPEIGRRNYKTTFLE